MPPVNYIEWRNANAQRNFPFADEQTLMATSLYSLSNSVILDAFFYPVNLEGALYLSGISTQESTIKISDDNGVVASAAFTAGQTVMDFYDDYDRHIGTMLVSDDFENLSDDLVFTADTTAFAVECVAAQNQPGVRGILMPDGVLISGDVVFQGDDGMLIDSYTDAGKNILRISARGVQDIPECVDLADPIKCIDVNQVNAGSLTISRSGANIYIAHRSQLEDVCTTKEYIPDDEGNLTGNHDDPCLDPPTPDSCPPNPSWTPPGACPSDPSSYTVTGLGSLFQVEPHTGDELAGASLLDYIYNPLLPPKTRQGLRLSLRGIGADNA